MKKERCLETDAFSARAYEQTVRDHLPSRYDQLILVLILASLRADSDDNQSSEEPASRGGLISEQDVNKNHTGFHFLLSDQLNINN